jgi:hypothetical protein
MEIALTRMINEKNGEQYRDEPIESENDSLM